MSARVLVVDDIITNVKLLEAKLSAEYFDVVTALNGPDAIAICERGEADIVLLDVMMPGMNGFDVCRRLKSEATTAILVTGLAMAIPVAVWLAQRHPSAAVLSVWAVVTGLAALFLIVTILAPLVFQLLGKAPTLTGRTDIWRALAEPIAQRPWFGWGYQAFWTDTSLTSPVDRVESIMEGFRPPDAHSTPIDIRLQLGLVGLILVGLTFARTWLQILLQAGRQPAMMPAVGIFTAITAMAFTESIGLYPMDGMTLIVQLVVVKTALSAWDRRNSTPNKSQLG